MTDEFIRAACVPRGHHASLPTAVWRERTDTVGLLLARGAAVSREVLDLLQHGAGER